MRPRVFQSWFSIPRFFKQPLRRSCCTTATSTSTTSSPRNHRVHFTMKESSSSIHYYRYLSIRRVTRALLIILTVCWPFYFVFLGAPIVKHESSDMATLHSLLLRNSTTSTIVSNGTLIDTKLNHTSIGSVDDLRHAKRNRTLVVLTGNLRGGEEAWKSLYRHVLDVNQADLALLIGATPHMYINASLFQRTRYLWTVDEYDDWANAMEQIEDKDTNWRQRLFGLIGDDPGENILLGAAGNIRGSGAIVFMFRWYLAKYIQQLHLLEYYDRFVVTRADHYYQCAHNLALLDPQYLWVPEGEDYFGICDRHFVANSKTILPALNIFPPLVKNPETYRHVLQSKHYNTESFLFLRWYEQGLGPFIRRFQRNMFAVATTSDGTRWGKPSVKQQNIIPGLSIKYINEYYASSQTCGMKRVARRQLVGVPGYVSKPNNRILVVLLGNLTGTEEIWNTMVENVLKVNRADLALVVPFIPYGFRSSLRRLAKYLWGVPEFDDWTRGVELIDGKHPDWRIQMIDTVPNSQEQQLMIGGSFGIPSADIVKMTMMWFLSEQLRQHKMHVRYDRFVITRPDYFYRCAHNFSKLDSRYVWSPTIEHYHHVSNFHIVANRHSILPALNLLPPLVSRPDHYRLLLSDEKYNARTILQLRWKQDGLSSSVRFFDPMFVTPALGKVPDRNGTINLTLTHQLYMRYPEEYQSSLNTCRGGIEKVTTGAVN